MELFAKITKNEKPFIIFSKTSILDVWQGSEYDSELSSQPSFIFKSIQISEVTDNPLLGKNKKK